MDRTPPKFTDEEFIAFCQKQSSEIKKQSFDLKQISRIHEQIKMVLDTWARCSRSDKIDKMKEVREALFELILSMEIALSNYRKENKSVWAAIFGWSASKIPPLKIPEL